MPLYKKRCHSYELEAVSLDEEKKILEKLNLNHLISSDKRFDNQANLSNETISESDQLANVKKELIQFYGFTDDHFDEEIEIKNDYQYEVTRVYGKKNYYASPRARFLIWKYRKLNEIINNKITNIYEKLQQYIDMHNAFNVFKKSVDILKKPLDAADDIVSASRQSLSPNVSTITMSSVLGVLHLFEGVNGAWIVCKTLNNEKFEQSENQSIRIANIATGSATAGIGTAGVVIAGKALALEVANENVGNIALQSSSKLLTSYLSALMTVILLLASWRKGIRYSATDLKYENERYEIVSPSYDNEANDSQKTEIIIDLKKRIPLQMEKIKIELDKIKKEIDVKQIEINNKHDEISLMRLKDHERVLSNQYFELDYHLNKIKRLREKTKEKKSHFIFSIFETLSSFTVCAGMLLGVSALSISSFGIIPSVLIGVGIGAGFLVKIIEAVDEKYHILKPIKKWFNDRFRQKEEIKESMIESKKIKEWLSSTNCIQSNLMKKKQERNDIMQKDVEKKQLSVELISKISGLKKTSASTCPSRGVLWAFLRANGNQGYALRPEGGGAAKRPPLGRSIKT